MMRRMIVVLGWAVLVTGCSGLPVTDGFRGELPSPGTPTIVWGNDLSAVGTAATWLQKQGLDLVERSTLALDLETDTIELAHTLQDEGAVLRAAKKLGVAEVVFVDVGGDYRAPMVTVRGFHVASGRVRWSGSARYATFETRPFKDALANLTCQALATAWGVRPPGTKWFTSSEKMCAVRGAAGKESK